MSPITGIAFWPKLHAASHEARKVCQSSGQMPDVVAHADNIRASVAVALRY